MGFLQKIRSKSDKEKNIISAFFAGGVTLIIVMLWLSFDQPNRSKPADLETKLSSISPFETLTDQLGAIKKNLAENLNKATNQMDQVIKEATTTENINQ